MLVRRAVNLKRKEKRADLVPVSVSSVCVAIDGTAASGKSSTALGVATSLSYRHFSTGLLYRAVAVAVKRANILATDHSSVATLLRPNLLDLRLDKKGTYQLYLNNLLIEVEKLEQPIFAQTATQVSAQQAVRDYLLPLQRNLIEKKGMVMDGRDIGTVVLPEAEVKVFLSAPVEIRAERRLKQLNTTHISHTREEIIASLIARDEHDSSRSISPLRPAKNAVHIDTSQYTQEEQITRIVEIVRTEERKV